MGRTCTVCTHADRKAIEADLINPGGASLRVIASAHGLSVGALHRHKVGCIGAAIVKATEAAATSRGTDLLGQIRTQQARAEQLYTEASTVLRAAKRTRDHETSLRAIATAAATLREARGILELLTKVYLASSSVLSREEALTLLDQVVGVIRHHVRDRETLAAIAGEFAGLVRRHPMEITC
jgi:hypothetical protein